MKWSCDCPCALITGITGQDGSYLTEWLIQKGYQVHGTTHRKLDLSSWAQQLNIIDHHRLTIHLHDLKDDTSLAALLKSIRPHDIYHLAGQSHVKASFDAPDETIQINQFGTQNLLKAIQCARLTEAVRLYHASSSEMFGCTSICPQSETTPFAPHSPYAVSKVYAHQLVVDYRHQTGLFACNGILFNHESPRRKNTFVTRKITQAVAKIKRGFQQELLLGSLDTYKDWGYAKEYVEAMWLMLQQPQPDDYVIATGQSHSVRDFCATAFDYVGLNWQNYVRYDPTQSRPQPHLHAQGDPQKAERILGWKAQTAFKELVYLMVEADLACEQKES